jgi:CheY-like chemotaxis protein
VPSCILVVDDEPAVRDMVLRTLRDDGYDVVSVTTGELALEKVGDGGIDLVVTNNFMPGMSGAQLIDILADRFPDLPLLHIDEANPAARPEHRIPDEVVTLLKPFSPASLRATVEGLLARRLEE